MKKLILLSIQLCFMTSMLCVSITPSIAGDLSILLNGKAHHLKNAPDGKTFNEQNWGAGFQYDYTGWDKDWIPFITVSGFLDSHKNPSYYAGGGMMRRFKVEDSDIGLYTDVGLVAFLMTRENFKNNKPFPGILPVMTVGTQYVAMNITYIPKVSPKMVALFFFQLKVNILEF